MFLSFLKTLFEVLNKFFDIWRQRQQLDAGQAQQDAANKQETLDAIAKTTEARDRTRRDDSSATDANQLPDDGFKRD